MCERWPASLRLLSSSGEFVQGRCRATGRCDYCGRLGAVENAEMVALDACSFAPSLFVVLTTRDPSMSRHAVKEALRHAVRAVRRRWPSFEYACFVEFTSGLSVWSGGHRRIHLNLLVKGVPADDADDLQRVLLDVWGSRTNTTQLHVGPVYAAEGLVRYVTNLALHVMKDGQKPPADYAGHLVRWSRGYFVNGATAMREQARASLRHKRELYRLAGAGITGAEAESIAALELLARDSETWSLVRVRKLRAGGVLEPLGEVERPKDRARPNEGLAYRAGALVNTATGEVWARAG